MLLLFLGLLTLTLSISFGVQVWKRSEKAKLEANDRRNRKRQRTTAPGDEEREAQERRRQHRYLLLNRSCKVLVHEIGHLFGLGHCIYYDCCMNGSGHLAEDYRQAMHLCPVDLRKLQHCLGFDVEERYKAMAAFYRKYKMGFEAELKWMERRIESLVHCREDIG